MEENQTIQLEQIDYSQQLEELQKSNQEINKSINDLLKFFETEKEEQQLKQEEEQEILNQEKQKEEEEQQEFYTNIKTIAENSDTETQLQLLQDVSTLMQVNIMCSGLLIGIICISLLAKFFKR